LSHDKEMKRIRELRARRLRGENQGMSTTASRTDRGDGVDMEPNFSSSPLTEWRREQ